MEGDPVGVSGSGDRTGTAAAIGIGSGRRNHRTTLIVVFALLATTLLFRLPSLQRDGIEADESLYLIMAHQWLQGGLPYVAVWDHHPIGVPALFALSQSVLGPEVMVIRILAATFVGLTVLLLYGLVRSRGGQVSTALAAALFYAGYTSVEWGRAANSEIFFIPFTVLGFGMLMAEARRVAAANNLRLMVIATAGLAFGVALQCKYVVVFEAAVPLGALTWLAMRHNLGRDRVVATVLVFGAAMLLPTVASGVYFAAAGHFREFFEANFLANLSYVTMNDTDAPGNLYNSARALLPMIPLMVVVGLSSFFDRESRFQLAAAAARPPDDSGWLWLWLGAAALDVILPMKFYPHYFLILVAPLSLLAATKLERVSVILFDARHHAAGVALAVAALLSLPGLRLPSSYVTASRDVSRAASDYIRARLEPGASIYVANDEPIIYYLTGVPIPTRFAFPADLTSRYSRNLPVDPLVEIGRIFDRQPQFVVLRRPPRIGELRPAVALINELLAQSYQRDCVLVRGESVVEIYRRKPPPAIAEPSLEFCK